MPSTIRGSDNFDSAGGNACKAWVNFNGTGTVAIRAAFNVSSITDNGVGDYTVNFTSTLTDGNYAGVFLTGETLGANYWGPIPYTFNRSASALRVRNNSGTGSYYDPTDANVLIFR